MPRKKTLLWLALLCLHACIEPTPPKYQLEEPFYLVEGEMVNEAGLSEIRVRQSNFRQIQLEFDPVTDAAVVAVNAAAGTRVPWELQDAVSGTYQPPADFRVLPGERWYISVGFPDGTQAESLPETVPVPAPLDDIRIILDQEGDYDQDLRRFVPRFRLYADFSDPAGIPNYYEWDYRYWEREVVCISCYCGVYRGDGCLDADRCNQNNERYDYYCEATADGCFRLTRGQGLNYGTDQAFDGGRVSNQPVGTIDFLDYGGLLVEVLQYSLSPEAYAYGKVIADLVSGNTGLNPTIPAALSGNLANLDPDGPLVLGNVRAAAVTRRRLYLERNESTGEPLPGDRSIRLEPSSGAFTPPRAPCEGPGRTPVKPEGWPD